MRSVAASSSTIPRTNCFFRVVGASATTRLAAAFNARTDSRISPARARRAAAGKDFCRLGEHEVCMTESYILAFWKSTLSLLYTCR